MEVEVSPPLVLEGGSVILLRRIAISGLTGQLEVRTVSHEMELCDCVYEADSPDVHGFVSIQRVPGARINPYGRTLI